MNVASCEIYAQASSSIRYAQKTPPKKLKNRCGLTGSDNYAAGMLTVGSMIR